MSESRLLHLQHSTCHSLALIRLFSLVSFVNWSQLKLQMYNVTIAIYIIDCLTAMKYTIDQFKRKLKI